MNKSIEINVRDFSTAPIGRYISQSAVSGERFREELLLPALRKYDTVIVNWSGVEGYGSSFLDEAFGGLVREHNFDPAELIIRIVIVAPNDESLEVEIHTYINESQPREGIEYGGH